MVECGKDHLGATCVVAANLAERAWTVMRRREPYVIRDTDGHRGRGEDHHRRALDRGRRRAGTATLQEGEEGPQARPHRTIETTRGPTGRPSPHPVLGPRQLTVKPRTPVRPAKILDNHSPIGDQPSSSTPGSERPIASCRDRATGRPQRPQPGARGPAAPATEHSSNGSAGCAPALRERPPRTPDVTWSRSTPGAVARLARSDRCLRPVQRGLRQQRRELHVGDRRGPLRRPVRSSWRGPVRPPRPPATERRRACA